MRKYTVLNLMLMFVVMAFVGLAHAQSELEESVGESIGDSVERDPAAAKVYSGKRTYPGGADEEDLRVQNHLADAAVKTDSRVLQREVYRKLYNQELKDEREEAVEE